MMILFIFLDYIFYFPVASGNGFSKGIRTYTSVTVKWLFYHYFGEGETNVVNHIFKCKEPLKCKMFAIIITHLVKYNEKSLFKMGCHMIFYHIKGKASHLVFSVSSFIIFKKILNYVQNLLNNHLSTHFYIHEISTSLSAKENKFLILK